MLWEAKIIAKPKIYVKTISPLIQECHHEQSRGADSAFWIMNLNLTMLLNWAKGLTSYILHSGFGPKISDGFSSSRVSISDVFASDLWPKLQCYFQLFLDRESNSCCLLLRSIPRACHWQQEQTIRCTCAIICCSNCKDSNIGWQIQLRDFQEPFHPWEYYFVCVYQHYHSPQSRKLHTFLITVLLSDNARNSKAILLIWGFFFNDKELTFQFIIAKEEEVRFVCQKYRNC